MTTSSSNPPPKCPVCGSTKLTTRYKDGVESYNCDKGHVFIVEKDQRDRAA